MYLYTCRCSRKWPIDFANPRRPGRGKKGLTIYRCHRRDCFRDLKRVYVRVYIYIYVHVYCYTVVETVFIIQVPVDSTRDMMVTGYTGIRGTNATRIFILDIDYRKEFKRVV